MTGGGQWQHDLFQKAAITKPSNRGAKVSITNLDFGVTDNDIRVSLN